MAYVIYIAATGCILFGLYVVVVLIDNYKDLRNKKK